MIFERTNTGEKINYLFTCETFIPPETGQKVIKYFTVMKSGNTNCLIYNNLILLL